MNYLASCGVSDCQLSGDCAHKDPTKTRRGAATYFDYKKSENKCNDHIPVSKPRMLESELIDKLLLLKENGDPEIAHWEADQLLLDYIDNRDVSKAFGDIDKWYA